MPKAIIAIEFPIKNISGEAFSDLRRTIGNIIRLPGFPKWILVSVGGTTEDNESGEPVMRLPISVEFDLERINATIESFADAVTNIEEESAEKAPTGELIVETEGVPVLVEEVAAGGAAVEAPVAVIEKVVKEKSVEAMAETPVFEMIHMTEFELPPEVFEAVVAKEEAPPSDAPPPNGVKPETDRNVGKP